MTAVVGILNKKAVAIAADSAVTTGSGKIFNKANKIFTLSKYHPVGVLIHNLDSFMGVPWETIIKMYRTNIGVKELETVDAYKQDFINFLREKNYFSSKEQQAFKVNYLCVQNNNYLFKTIGDKYGSATTIDNKLFNDALKTEIIERIKIFKLRKVMPEFSTFSFEDFEKYIADHLDEIYKYSFKEKGVTIEKDVERLLLEAYYQELIVQDYSLGYTGLVFTGFGKSEVFPSLIPLHIFYAFDNKLRYDELPDSGGIITDAIPSQICTFAQSDVMMTILTGIAPELQQAYSANLKDIFKEQEKLLVEKFDGDKDKLQELLDKIDKEALVTQYDGLMTDIIRQKYITPLYEAVAGLGGKSGQCDHPNPVEVDHPYPEQTDHLNPVQIDHPLSCI